jgi:hypothetical protein
MNNDINNMQDLYDDNISRSLRKIGIVFPRTAIDFKEIDAEVNEGKLAQPERLKNPFSFLGKRHFKGEQSIHLEEQHEYSTSLAQAAREGKVISDEVKKKMAADKLNSKKTDKE